MINIILFLFAQAMVGAQVVFNGIVLHKSIITPSFLDFSLIETIENMWKAGVYVLAMLILILSGIFPHIKLMVLG